MTVTFNQAVNVTGEPQLELQVGDDARQAAYSSGTGSAALVFSYTVAMDDEDTDGIAIDANKLVLNGGTIAAVSGGLAANLDHLAEAADSGHKVDGVRPTLEDAKNFGLANTVELVYSEPLQMLETFGAGGFTVKINGTDATILFVSTAATPEFLLVVFDPSVSQMRHGDTVTVSYTPPASNPVRDLAGNTIPSLTDEEVENQIPEPAAISSVALSSDPGTDATYGVGDTIDATVTFDRPVKVDEVAGTPSLELDVGGTARQAAYSSGSGDAELVFSYTVVAGDEDADGVSVGENKLEADDEAIGHSVEVEGVEIIAPANIDHNAVPDNAGHKVDGVAPIFLTAAVDTTSDDKALVMTYDEPLDTGSVPAGSAFSVTVGTATAANPDAVAVSGRTVTLTLAAAVGASDTVTLDYTKPASNPVQDVHGNDAATFSGQAVSVTTGPAASTDATLSGLVLNDGTNDLTLTPSFASATEAYTAEVVNSVESVTVTATANDGGATAATLPADADANAAGHQVALRRRRHRHHGDGHGRRRDHDKDLHGDGDPRGGRLHRRDAERPGAERRHERPDAHPELRLGHRGLHGGGGEQRRVRHGHGHGERWRRDGGNPAGGRRRQRDRPPGGPRRRRHRHHGDGHGRRRDHDKDLHGHGHAGQPGDGDAAARRDGAVRLEPEAERLHPGRQVPVAVHSLVEKKGRFLGHRGVQHLGSGPGRGRPRGHPGLQPHLPDAGQHGGHRRQGQHGDHGHGRVHPLAERRPGRRRLRGLLRRLVGRGGHGTPRDRRGGEHPQQLADLDGECRRRHGIVQQHRQPSPGQFRQRLGAGRQAQQRFPRPRIRQHGSQKRQQERLCSLWRVHGRTGRRAGRAHQPAGGPGGAPRRST